MSGISGMDRLYRLAGHLPELVNEALDEELKTAFEEPVAAFRSDVDRSISSHLPAGYEPTFAGSWNVLVKVEASGGSAKARLRGTARGRTRRRDSAALDRGVLRHKTWGRLPWHTQGIRPGFWSDPADRLVATMRDQMAEVVRKAAKRIQARL